LREGVSRDLPYQLLRIRTRYSADDVRVGIARDGNTCVDQRQVSQSDHVSLWILTCSSGRARVHMPHSEGGAKLIRVETYVLIPKQSVIHTERDSGLPMDDTACVRVKQRCR
jgi:hypothetical protein